MVAVEWFPMKDCHGEGSGEEQEEYVRRWRRRMDSVVEGVTRDLVSRRRAKC